MVGPARLPRISIPHEKCRDVMHAIRREWLVTNGLGGFACGTIAGALTRRYHGLLLAALHPPLGRTLLVSKLDETVHVAGAPYPLCTNIWTTGVESPAGCEWIEQFELIGGIPTWRYLIGDCELVKRVWMEHGHNATFVQYALAEDARAIEFSARLLVNYRDYHALSRPDDWRMAVEVRDPRMIIRAYDDAVPIHVRCESDADCAPEWEPDHTWYRKFYLPVEAERGYGHLEDHLSVGCCHLTLNPGDSVTFLAATESDAELSIPDALDRCERRARDRLKCWRASAGDWPRSAPESLAHLVLAAHQFVVKRPAHSAPDGHTVIAGYPWFSDWGRDTMVALPGLTLVTGQADIARQILLTWSRYVHDGLIPNRFPDAGDTPEYHTADATLWYLWAIDQYLRATDDVALLEELFPVAEQIIEWHRHGTRHNIHLADDGLICCGHAGINLTWMDAKIGDRVITPRTGKPVEVNALWYNALCNLSRWAALLGREKRVYETMAEAAAAAFKRFWNPARDACYDVIDGPMGDDARIQPNQIFAVALEHSPLAAEQQRGVVTACERKLLTMRGLRTLAADEPGYHGVYSGDQTMRDEAYHTGTVWGWLLGPFVIADYRVNHDRQRSAALLKPLLSQIARHGIGSLSEVFDGDAPHVANGAIAQAWTVAETLRAWHVTQAGGNQVATG